MSSYHHVKAGTAYPAVMLPHGVNDPRVDVWHSTKIAAQLMAAPTSGKPVLLNLDYDSGHGIGDTKAQRPAPDRRHLRVPPLADGAPGFPAREVSNVRMPGKMCPMHSALPLPCRPAAVPGRRRSRRFGRAAGPWSRPVADLALGETSGPSRNRQ